jgi:hypothetical protein
MASRREIVDESTAMSRLSRAPRSFSSSSRVTAPVPQANSTIFWPGPIPEVSTRKLFMAL